MAGLSRPSTPSWPARKTWKARDKRGSWTGICLNTTLRRLHPPPFADRGPYPFWRGRHVHVAYPVGPVQGIDDRVHDGRRRADGARFARSLHAQRIGRASHVAGLEGEWRRIGCTGQRVVHERGSDELTGRSVIDSILHDRLPIPCTAPPWTCPANRSGLSVTP